jgi:putative oxidoreductase
MKKLVHFNQNFGAKLSKLKDVPLLFLRLILSFGFSGPALMKIKDINSIATWFESLGMPMPLLNAYLATFTEFFGFIFLALGFATRIISVPLMIVMVVAIKTVHLEHGFYAGDHGFEIPLYYFLMLFTLFIYGPGKFSFDNLINNKMANKET